MFINKNAQADEHEITPQGCNYCRNKRYYYSNPVGVTL